ncbi:MAG TPA: hypothetical protein VHU13_02450 [Solirubrobacteraceae bacterium]|jgi:hypothetical protein|nr:hypothetical protein [Solirubrobacteraceae bacterium]
MNVVPRWMVAGEPVVIFGRLHCDRQARAAGRQVKLFHHLLGQGGGFTYVQSVTTNAEGFYAIDRADGVVESNRLWYVQALDARSATRGVRVAATVTLSGPTEGQLLTGGPNAVTFTGTVSPADVGARVILQRQSGTAGREWHPIGSGTVVPGPTAGAPGVFTILHAFRVPGDANVRALVRSQSRNVPSASNVLSYEITQAQNPKLTIQASADPIAFGESVTIGGKLEGAAGVPVTLYARTALQHGFAPVAQMPTNASGEYAFPPQSPVNSTFYRVKSGSERCPHAVEHCPGGVLSAVLYEGVKDVLTAQVSASSVQAGQPIAFSGTVAPDHTGDTIYLERQNAHLPGFHVVEVGVIGAGSRYSLTRRFYDPGTKVVRVFVPGGPENSGAASQPFTITVTPAPASALTPEPPQNAGPPQEGQS